MKRIRLALLKRFDWLAEGVELSESRCVIMDTITVFYEHSAIVNVNSAIYNCSCSAMEAFRRVDTVRKLVFLALTLMVATRVSPSRESK